MEKKVMIRLCAKVVADTDLYETDKEVQNLIDRVCLSEQIKENNNTIRNLTGEYKRIEPDCREGVRVQLGRMKQLCTTAVHVPNSFKNLCPCENNSGLEARSTSVLYSRRVRFMPFPSLSTRHWCCLISSPGNDKTGAGATCIGSICI